MEHVSVLDFGAVGDGVADDSIAINAALLASKNVEFPGGYTFKTSGTISVASGSFLTVNGKITGTGTFLCSGSVSITGTGSFEQNSANIYKVDVNSGNIYISGVSFIGTGLGTFSGHAIGVTPSTSDVISSIRIKDCRFYGTQYGILRNGSQGTVIDVEVDGNIFNNIVGDPFEWNVGVTDKRISVINNIIDTVDSSLTNQGIGIGIAGSSYQKIQDVTSASWAGGTATLTTFVTHTIQIGDSIEVDGFTSTGSGSFNGSFTVTNTSSNTISYSVSTDPGQVRTFGTVSTLQPEQILVANNQLSNLRQGIHFEACRKFKVFGNKLKNVSSAYSTASTLSVVDIVAYGCDRFEITDNTSENGNGIAIRGGTSGGVYYKMATNATIARNKLIDCVGTTQIRVETGGKDTYVSVSDNEIIGGGQNSASEATIAVRGCPGRLYIENNRAITPAKMNFLLLDLQNATYATFAPGSRRMVTIRGNSAQDNLGQPFNTFTSVTADRYEINGNNFQVTGISTLEGQANRTYYSTVAGVPYGIEYQIGDVLIDTATPARAIVTVAGSRNRATDTFSVVDNTAGVNKIRSTNYPWTVRTAGGHHEVGQRITLSGAGVGGADLQTRVVRVFIESSEYRMEVEDVITASAGAAGTITSTNPVTTVAI
jgi:hypothetical protein